jgi:hypothetical protein
MGSRPSVQAAKGYAAPGSVCGRWLGPAVRVSVVAAFVLGAVITRVILGITAVVRRIVAAVIAAIVRGIVGAIVVIGVVVCVVLSASALVGRAIVRAGRVVRAASGQFLQVVAVAFHRADNLRAVGRGEFGAGLAIGRLRRAERQQRVGGDLAVDVGGMGRMREAQRQHSGNFRRNTQQGKWLYAHFGSSWPPFSDAASRNTALLTAAGQPL